jgi:hypothetical protein
MQRSETIETIGNIAWKDLPATDEAVNSTHQARE